MFRLETRLFPALLLTCFLAGLPYGYWIIGQSFHEDKKLHDLMLQADAVHIVFVHGELPPPVSVVVEAPSGNSMMAMAIMYYANEQWKRWLQKKIWLDSIKHLQCPQDGRALPGSMICYDLNLLKPPAE